MKAPLPLFCLLPFFFSSVQGQTPPLDGPDNPCRVRFVLLANGGPSVELYNFAEETTIPPEPVRVGTRSLSKPITTESRQFQLALRDASQKSGFRKTGLVTLPEVGDDFIVLLLPEDHHFTPFVVDSSATTFRPNNILFFNTTETPLAAKLDDEVTIISPRTPTFAPSPDPNDASWYQVSLYYPVSGGGAKIFSNTRWPHRKSVRSIVFLFRDSTSRRITYQAIDDRI